MASETEPIELAGGIVYEIIDSLFLLLILPFLTFQK